MINQTLDQDRIDKVRRIIAERVKKDRLLTVGAAGLLADLDEEEDGHTRSSLIHRINEAGVPRGYPLKYTTAFDSYTIDQLESLLERVEAEPLPLPQVETIPQGARPNSFHKDTASDQHATKAKDQFPGIKTGQGYFARVPNDAIVDVRLTSTDKCLLLVLIALCSGKGYCWHSEETLGKMLVSPTKPNGLTFKQVQRGIARLKRCEYIAIYTPEGSKALGYDTHDSPTNTIVVTTTVRDGA